MQKDTISSVRRRHVHRVRFAERFQGPPGMANGGYVAGCLAAFAGTEATITIRRPVPLDRPLGVESRASGAVLCDGEVVLAEAENTAPKLELPSSVSFDAARWASARFLATATHPFPHCFVCGPARASGDALRLLPGPTDDRRAVAAPWVPGAKLCRDVSGEPVREVPTELVWAALDCPGAWSIYQDLRAEPFPIVLGRIAGRIFRRPRPGERLAVVGWSLGHERRKHFCGTAIFDEAGEPCACAQSTWIALG